MNYANLFEKQGFVIIKNLIDRKLSKIIYDYLRFQTQISILNNQNIRSSSTVPECIGQRSNDIFLDTILNEYKSDIETYINKKLYPTYCLARIYTNGCELIPHKDRPSCEISVTVKLSDTKNYNYPLFIEGNKIVLEDGDGVIYKGTDVLHWRNKCDAEEKYYMGQMFMHYVEIGGKYNDYKYDKISHRQLVLENELWNNLQ